MVVGAKVHDRREGEEGPKNPEEDGQDLDGGRPPVHDGGEGEVEHAGDEGGDGGGETNRRAGSWKGINYFYLERLTQLNW